jgi:hypothetical protein
MGTDRTELNDLAARRPNQVEAMARKWEAWAAANQVTPMPRSYRVDYLPER